VKGIIDSVWENESRNGKKYLTVEIGGERYSVWDTKYFDVLQEGAEISYDFRQSGEFKNLTDVAPVQEQQHAPVYNNTKDRSITRLSCLRSASEILAPVHMDTEDKKELVIDTARYFERYVTEEDAEIPDIPFENAGRGKDG
jgi:hypothetical protein